MEITYNQIQEFRIKTLKELLVSGKAELVKDFMFKWGLEARDGKIYPKNKYKDKYDTAEEYWDRRQLVKKINLNSAYGALLNASSRFFDQRLGQSTTLTGRTITKHMAAKTNEMMTGDYDHYGKSIVYGDTDSEISTTLHKTSKGEHTIESLFESCTEKWEDGDKEYAYDPDLMVMTYNKDIDEPYLGHTEYIYRHRVSKALYEIEDVLGNVITVTEDHSVMIERDNALISVKPADILATDILISIALSETNDDN